MNALAATPLVNLLGFAVGIVLYALLLWMTLRNPRRTAENRPQFDSLLLATAVLGLLWNAGELAVLIESDFNWRGSLPVLSAIAYTALGFLPAVVVHSAKQQSEHDVPKINFVTFAAYFLSGAAAVLHFSSAIFNKTAPSSAALYVLTAGYSIILAALFFLTVRQTAGRKAIWASALAVFAVSALHLSQPHDSDDYFLLELVGHQAALPLVVAILLQDFRFAFADLFLKRALSLVLLTLAAFGLYVFAFLPLSNLHASHGANDSQPIFILLGLWIATALVYQKLHRLAVWAVDKILLRRVDYEILRTQIAREIAELESSESILNAVSARLGAALTAAEANWTKLTAKHENAEINFANNLATILIATAESPFYQINLSNFAGARRLLSDEIEMLADVAVLTARRIDAVRVTTERFARELREQQTVKLAAEAELRALRAQINPHFLFNALTTIGYLINTEREKALETLLKLTQLLRGVLRSNSEFSALGDELKLIETYLDIERARFEERLTVKIEVSPELRGLKIPSLILQPLVENAVKHGISNAKRGGEVRISARIDAGILILEVADTGAGFDETNAARGIGLDNVASRLKIYFGDAANLIITGKIGVGTNATLKLPLSGARI